MNIFATVSISFDRWSIKKSCKRSPENMCNSNPTRTKNQGGKKTKASKDKLEIHLFSMLRYQVVINFFGTLSTIWIGMSDGSLSVFFFTHILLLWMIIVLQIFFLQTLFGSSLVTENYCLLKCAMIYLKKFVL